MNTNYQRLQARNNCKHCPDTQQAKEIWTGKIVTKDQIRINPKEKNRDISSMRLHFFVCPRSSHVFARTVLVRNGDDGPWRSAL